MVAKSHTVSSCQQVCLSREDPWGTGSGVYVCVAYFFMQLVMRMWISCLSSSSSMAPRYPSLLSENRGEAISFSVSICHLCVCVCVLRVCDSNEV